MLDFLELVPPAVAIRVGVVTNKKAAAISGPRTSPISGTYLEVRNLQRS